ncbi:MAG: hypothetical protein JXR22_10135 [Prolixibacteraceae bacterium]|nr:hypothetical protein [Prolixibacteraceae bacterium]
MKHNGFKYRYRQRMIARSALNVQRIKQFTNASSVRTIGFVADEAQKIQALLAFFEKGLTVHTLVFSYEKRLKNDNRDAVFSNDLNFWGLPSKENVQVFVNQPFDLLINLLPSPFDPADYVCSQSIARLKVARYPLGEVYDLIIRHDEPELNTYINEIVKTLNNFSL